MGFVLMCKKSECINHKGGTSHNGYGMTWLDGSMKRAHRVAYVNAHGLELKDIDGKMVLHRCDNRLCVNPDHLFLGTAKDNSEDMVSKGRSNRGERNGQSKLSESDVYSIRRDQRSQSAIARDWGVSQSLVSMIKSGRRW